MMKPLRLMLFVLLLAACSTGEVGVLPTVVETAVVVNSDVAVTATLPIPTYTSVPLTPTSLLEPSSTPTTLPTATQVLATSTPLPSPTPNPFIQGTLYFIWQPEPKPAPEDMGPGEVPAKSLYVAIPGQALAEWEITPILTDIRCFCQPLLSPDKSQLAFIQTEDSNQDGYFYSSEDRQTLYTYDLQANRLTRLDHFDFSEQFSWLSDNQTLLYRYKYNSNWGLTKTDGLPSVPLVNNPQGTSENPLNIRHIVNSPNGQLQAIIISVSPARLQLALFDITQRTAAPILDANGVDILVTWSPDNKRLAATLIAEAQELYAIDTETLTVVQILTTESLEKRVYPPVWSEQGDWLAFIQDKTTLWGWHQPTAIVEQLASKSFVGSPVWAPHEDIVAVNFTTDEVGGILLANPAEKSLSELVLDSQPIGSPIWTPDGEWLLFPAKRNEATGYYMIHRQGGDIYPVFDTTGLYEPSDFFWLSN